MSIMNIGDEPETTTLDAVQPPAVEGAGELGLRELEGAALLDELATLIRRFVVLPEWGAEALALWTLHSECGVHATDGVCVAGYGRGKEGGCGSVRGRGSGRGRGRGRRGGVRASPCIRRAGPGWRGPGRGLAAGEVFVLVSEGHCGDWAAAGHAGEPLQSPTGAFLLDIMVLFFSGNLERVTSRGMVEWLNRRGERPWRVLTGGKAVSEVWLAGRLRLYGIRPRTLRVEGVVSRGYAREDFLETFKRYISRAEWDELRR